MPSLRSRLLFFIMRNRHWLRFQRKKENIDWNKNESILRFRHECEEGAKRFGKIPGGIEVTPFRIDGISSEWIMPSQTTKDKLIFFVHGGGYVSGSCSDHRIHVAKFVKGSNIGALLFEYRLAPEHPFPAALDDSVAVYRWLLAHGVSSPNIVFAGDSAGGGLCLATLLALKDQGVPLPSAVVAISPWTDLKCSGGSYRSNARKCLSPDGIWTAFSKHYAGCHDPSLPWISPVYGDLHGLPPMLIYVGGDEILRDDSVCFAEKAKDAGVDVKLRVGEGLFHCFPVCAPLFPEASQAMAEICCFIKMHLMRENALPIQDDSPGAKSSSTDTPR
jgi:monoterpene epsilon-lactone hydrolase